MLASIGGGAGGLSPEMGGRVVQRDGRLLLVCFFVALFQECLFLLTISHLFMPTEENKILCCFAFRFSAATFVVLCFASMLLHSLICVSLQCYHIRCFAFRFSSTKFVVLRFVSVLLQSPAIS